MRRVWTILSATMVLGAFASSAKCTDIEVSGFGHQPALWDSFHVDWVPGNPDGDTATGSGEGRQPGHNPIPEDSSNNGNGGANQIYFNAKWNQAFTNAWYAVEMINVQGTVPATVSCWYDYQGTNYATFTASTSPEPTMMLLLAPASALLWRRRGAQR